MNPSSSIIRHPAPFSLRGLGALLFFQAFKVRKDSASGNIGGAAKSVWATANFIPAVGLPNSAKLCRWTIHQTTGLSNPDISSLTPVHISSCFDAVACALSEKLESRLSICKYLAVISRPVMYNASGKSEAQGNSNHYHFATARSGKLLAGLCWTVCQADSADGHGLYAAYLHPSSTPLRLFLNIVNNRRLIAYILGRIML